METGARRGVEENQGALPAGRQMLCRSVKGLAGLRLRAEKHGAPSLSAINASTVRRWPQQAEEAGVCFAGDLAFGGVMIVQGSKDMLFVQPADWQRYEQVRAQADAQRRTLAEQAGISRLLEKEPTIMVGG